MSNLHTGFCPPLKLASPCVAEKMKAKLMQRLVHDRDKLQHMRESAGKASAFAGWMQKNVVHETLLEGGTSLLCGLGSHSDTELVINKTVGHCKRFKMQVNIAEVLKDVHKLPDSSTLESVDSHCFDGTTLWRFQMTSNVDHGVKLMGLLHLVEHLGLTNAVRANPAMAKTVFVTPSKVAGKFKRQEIVTEQIFNRTVDDFSRMECNQISGIGPMKKRKLQEKGIRTVDDLLKARSEAITSVKLTVEAFRNNMRLMQDAAFWFRVEQFVHGINPPQLAKF